MFRPICVSESMSVQMMHGGPEGEERQNKDQKKRVLTVCCHPAWCLLLCVCMALTSSVEKFCQIWSGLTFSLSRHVYSSPIPIKISTLSLPVSLPLAQTFIILYPSSSALSPSLALTYTPILNLKTSSTLCHSLSFVFFRFFVFLYVRTLL